LTFSRPPNLERAREMVAVLEGGRGDLTTKDTKGHEGEEGEGDWVLDL
jgi:hypothetical protein